MTEKVYDYISNNICIVESDQPFRNIDCNFSKCLCKMCINNISNYSNKCMLSDHLYITNKIKYTTNEEKYINIININLANASPIPLNNIKCSNDEFKKFFEYLLSDVGTYVLNDIQKNEVYDIICCQEFDVDNDIQIRIIYNLCKKYNYIFFMGKIYKDDIQNGLATLISINFMIAQKFIIPDKLLHTTYSPTLYTKILSMEIISANDTEPVTFGNIILINQEENIKLIIYNCKYKVVGFLNKDQNTTSTPNFINKYLWNIKTKYQWNLYMSSKIIEHSYDQIYNSFDNGKTIIIISGDFNYKNKYINKYIYPNIREYYDLNIQTIFNPIHMNIDFDYYKKLIHFYKTHVTENNDIIKLNNDYIIPFVINNEHFINTWYSMIERGYSIVIGVSQNGLEFTRLRWYIELYLRLYNKYLKIKKNYLLLKNSLK